MTSLTQVLAAHVAEAKAPPEAVRAAKRSLLDAVGVMLAASGLGEGCAAFAEQAREAAGAGKAVVLGYGFSAPAALAALANGAMAHALDYEDAYDGAPIHPNAPTIPAALAIGQTRAGVTGADLIDAMALGCDLVCRLGLALDVNPDEYGFYPPPILGAFGAAAAAGRLLRLDGGQMVDAFALTLSQSIATAQFKENPASQIRAVRDGFAAQAGVLAAQLAARGVKGFDGVFEGKAGLYALYARGRFDKARALQGLGAHFHGADISFKPWPACRGTHAFIEAALALRAEHGLGGDEIARLYMRGAPVMTMLAEPFAQKAAPRTAIDAKFSLPFTVATAIVRGDVKLAHFSAEALGDSAILALAARASFSPAPGAGAGMADATRGALDIVLKDGRTLTRTITHPRGHPSNPLSDEDLRSKFFDCASYAVRPLARDALDAFVEGVDRLESRADIEGLCFGL